MIKAEEVFNPKDFESIQLFVYLKNLTTRTKLATSKKMALLEIRDLTRELVVALPDKSCSAKQSVMLEIKQKINGKEEPLLAVTGKVLSIEAQPQEEGFSEAGGEMVRVTMECVQYDERSWDRLFNLYRRRQQEITQFLEMVKG